MIKPEEWSKHFEKYDSELKDQDKPNLSGLSYNSTLERHLKSNNIVKDPRN